MELPDDIIIRMATESELVVMIDIAPSLRRELAIELYQRVPGKTIEYLIAQNHDDLLDILYNMFKVDLHPWMITLAIQQRADRVLNYLLSHDVIATSAAEELCFVVNDDVIERMMTAQGYIVSEKAITLAARHGDLKTVIKLCQRVHPSHSAIEGAAGQGHLDVVRYLHAVQRLKITERAVELAARGCYQNVVQYLCGHLDYCIISDKMMAAAAGGGCDNIIEHLLTNGGQLSVKVIEEAAKNGHKNIVEKYYQQVSYLSAEVENAVIAMDDYDLFIKLFPPPSWSRSTLIYALEKGNSRVLEEAQKRFPLRPTDMMHALIRGREKIVRYLHEKKGFPITPEMIHFVVQSGNADCIRYVYERIPNTPLKPLWIAVKYYDTDFLVEIMRDIPLTRGSVVMAMETAAHLNDFEKLDILHRTRLVPPCNDFKPINAAASKGHLHMVKHLYSLGYKVAVVDDSVAGQLPSLKYLIANGAKTKTSMLKYSVERGYLETFKFLASLQTISTDVMEVAIRNNRPSIVNYMLRLMVPMKPMYLRPAKEKEMTKVLELFRNHLTDGVIRSELAIISGHLSTEVSVIVRQLPPRDAMRVAIDSKQVPRNVMETLYSYYLLD